MNPPYKASARGAILPRLRGSSSALFVTAGRSVPPTVPTAPAGPLVVPPVLVVPAPAVPVSALPAPAPATPAPVVPTPAPPAGEGADAYALRNEVVQAWSKELEKEAEKRERLTREYQRKDAIVEGVNSALLGVALSASAVGAGLMLTGIGLPLGVAIETGATVCGILAVAVGRFYGRRVNHKLHKSSKMAVLAQTLAGDFETALAGQVTQLELERLKVEVERFRSQTTVRQRRKTFACAGN